MKDKLEILNGLVDRFSDCTEYHWWDGEDDIMVDESGDVFDRDYEPVLTAVWHDLMKKFEELAAEYEGK